MKERIISLALALVLVVGMAVPALAASGKLESLIVKSDLEYGYTHMSEEGFILTMTDTDGDGNMDTDGLLDSNANEIKTPSGCKIESGRVIVSEGMVIVSQAVSGSSDTGNFKYGFMNTNGKLVVPLKYDRVFAFSEGLAAVVKTNRYEDYKMIPGMPVMVETDKMGFIDKTGKLVIPMIYDDIYSSSIIEDDGSGSTSSDKLFSFSEGLISVKKDGKWGVINKQGKTVLPFKYDSPIGSFHNGLASISIGRKMGFINRSGKVVISAAYDYVKAFAEGYAIVAKNDRTSRNGDRLYGAINIQGKLVVPIKYRDMNNFHDGMARVSDEPFWGGKYGFVNTSGKLVVPIKYTKAYFYSNGLAVVAVNDERFKEPVVQYRYGYIDKQGKVVIPIKYSSASSFSDGIASASLNVPDHSGNGSSAQFDGEPEYIYFDTTGNEVISHGKEYGEIDFSGKIGIMMQADGKYAIVRNPCYGGTTAPAIVGNFTDVLATAYYAESVAWAVEKKITSGTGAITFSPNNTCTTAQILTFLWRANGSPEPTINNPFSDVADNDYYTKAARWAYEKGLVSGSTFGASTPCTRSLTLTYLWKLAGEPAAGATSFTDVPGNADYAQAVAWAVNKKITSGTSTTTFSPDATCTRGQIMTFLYRDFAK